MKTLFTKRNVQTTEFQITDNEWDFYDGLTRYVEDQSIKAASDDSPRAHFLFGKNEGAAPTARRGQPKQVTLGDILNDSEQQELGWGDRATPKSGNTVLDRVHQSMLLFQAGRSEALRRFLVDGGTGQDQRFWRLAQALSALYPGTSDEKRWVDGVLARKKGLGL